ncbi:thiamine diphosphate-binding protein [Infundibulicybe gibba]|nr:thiamine diphosphate-binding protein [Infundibulicybe gibba]
MLQGLDAFDETNERSLRMLGRHGSAYASLTMQQADVIIAFGGRFNDRVTGKVDTFAPVAQGQGWIQPKNMNKVVDGRGVHPVLGDVVTNLAALVPLIRSYSVHHNEKMEPQEIIEELDAQTAHRKEDIAIATSDPRVVVTSGGLGIMGFGLPAAIGAKVVVPHKTVVDIDGDASFSMTAMELAITLQYGIGVKVLILNNEFQDLFYETRYSHTTMCSNAEELPAKMKEFLGCDGAKPIMMERVVGKSEHVFPMVVAGKALHEQIMHPSLGTIAKYISGRHTYACCIDSDGDPHP